MIADGFDRATVRPSAGSLAWRIGGRAARRIGLGVMRLTGVAAFHGGVPSDRDASIAVVRPAIELGVNHVDTAAFYFSTLRSANEIINAALAPFGDEVLVATKVGPRRDGGGDWETPARPEQPRGDVEANLPQPGCDYLDLVYLRNMRWESIAEHFGALAELKEAGLIRQLGLSDATPAQLEQAQAIAPVAAVQTRRRRAQCSRSPRPTVRRLSRSGRPGLWLRDYTSWPSREPATRYTWRRTLRQARPSSPRRIWRRRGPQSDSFQGIRAAADQPVGARGAECGL